LEEEVTESAPFGPRSIFADTSALFATADKRDEAHQAALQIQSRLIDESRPIFTTNFVLAELHALVLARIGHRIAFQILRELLASDVAIARVSVDDEFQAMNVLRIYTDKGFSYTDATSFAVMNRLGTRTAFTFDRHFAQYGFTMLVAP